MKLKLNTIIRNGQVLVYDDEKSGTYSLAAFAAALQEEPDSNEEFWLIIEHE